MVWYKERDAVIAMILIGIVSFIIGLSTGGELSNSSQQTTIKETSSAENLANDSPGEPAAKESPKVINLSGTGQQATEKFTLKTGLATAKLTHNGEGHFSAWLIDASGEKIELLANDSGKPFNGSKAFNVPSSGGYLLDVSAEDSWTIDITQ